MSEEDWVKAAMTDDSVVVELLFHLRRQSTTPPPPPKPKPKKDSSRLLSLPLEWTVRQRRSRPILHAAPTGAESSKGKKPAPSTARDSPTTPLSWSGGSAGATSVSGGSAGATAAADGFEESSGSPAAKRTNATRSKVSTTNETTTNKRAKKRKTLAELKEEEILLVKERRHLKREIATLRASVEKQRGTNESLKRLKLNFESQAPAEGVKAVSPIEASHGQTLENTTSCDPMPRILPPEVRIDDHEDTKQLPPAPKVSSELQPNLENKFSVPDLNLPVDDDFNS